MEYNDNFVLPPEEVLNKMRRAYKPSILKANILNKNQKIDDVKVLKFSISALNALTKSYFFIKELKHVATNKKATRLIKTLMDKTESNIEELKILYKDLEVKCYNNKANIRKNYCNSLKEAINVEVDTVKELFELRKLESNENTKQIVDRVTNNRLTILKELNSLFGTCSYRRYR